MFQGNRVFASYSAASCNSETERSVGFELWSAVLRKASDPGPPGTLCRTQGSCKGVTPNLLTVAKIGEQDDTKSVSLCYIYALYTFIYIYMYIKN